MLRIVTQLAEAEAELRRISERTQADQNLHREATVREILQTVRRQGDRACWPTRQSLTRWS
jgi:histidinol dehydrogenase